MNWGTGLLAAATFVHATGGFAQEQLTEAKAVFIFNGERISISRDNRDATGIATRFAAPDPQCGADCIVPMRAAEGVATLGEIEVLDFLETEVASNTGLMVDARMPDDRASGHIPGTVNLPHATLAPENGYRSEILDALGARETDGTFDFADARDLLVYDNGPGSDDSGKLIRNLLAEGYPAEKIRYYRGGMQVWSVLGFSIDEGKP